MNLEGLGFVLGNIILCVVPATLFGCYFNSAMLGAAIATTIYALLPNRR